MVGKTLGHYEIIEPLGAGGMGDVYRARDTKLGRDVAIKVLPGDFATDQDRLARLEREAHLLAALNHPNIATIHGLEEEDGARFLVLELVRGESLEQRLAKGPLSVETALAVCKQIAEALEAAHSEGIIHRDLKPANVLITPDSRAKVLDFGIAKSTRVDTEVADTARRTDLTATGTLIGTPAYMSPEQVRGEEIGARSDIWTFGCVLYEGLTARPAFGKATVADTLAAIINAEPDWAALPPATPTTVRALLRRCLQKATAKRLRHIGDAVLEIEEALEGSPEDRGGVAASPVRTSGAWRRALPWALAATLLGVVVLQTVVRPERGVPAPRQVFTVEGPPGTTVQSVVVSPAGDRAVFVAAKSGGSTSLWIRKRDATLEELPETEGARHPFWSPDGLSIGFFAEGRLKKTLATGGAVRQSISGC